MNNNNETKVRDLRGIGFNLFTIKEYNPKESTPDDPAWDCQCICGNYVTLKESEFDNTKGPLPYSCGCTEEHDPNAKNVVEYNERGGFYIGTALEDKYNRKFRFDPDDYDLITNHQWYRSADGDTYTFDEDGQPIELIPFVLASHGMIDKDSFSFRTIDGDYNDARKMNLIAFDPDDHREPHKRTFNPFYILDVNKYYN